jgi:hypothetical protein
MPEKSYVSMEQKKCLVCAKDFDSGAILLDRRMRQSLDRTTLTGWGLCPEHQKLYDDGYIALVGCDDAKSPKLPSGNVDPSQAWRTGTNRACTLCRVRPNGEHPRRSAGWEAIPADVLRYGSDYDAAKTK